MQGPGKESKGKRMAMKFMKQIGNKDKFVQNVPGLGRLTHKQESGMEVPAPSLTMVHPAFKPVRPGLQGCNGDMGPHTKPQHCMHWQSIPQHAKPHAAERSTTH